MLLEQEEKRRIREKRKRPPVEVDEEVAAAMGFGGFGSTKS